MASAAAIDTPPQEPHTLGEGPSMAFSSSPHRKSPRRSTYSGNSSTPLQALDAYNDSTSPPQPYTFTPRQVKCLPRAWERRPATPFVARNDAQKIWKRVPLGAIRSNIGENWKKETKRLNTRPVKRLRIAHLGGEEDKENVDYIASRWDEDGLTTASPKRKLLECGGVADRKIDLEDQDTPDEAHDSIEDDEDCGKPENGTASPILGSHEGAERWIEGEGADIETGTTTVLDSDSASSEAVGLPQPLSPIVGPLKISRASSPSPTAMQSSINTPMKPTDGDTASCGEREQDSHSSSATVSSAQDTGESVSTPLDDDDDTAFLHDFLSRARARKAAKEQTPHESPAQPNEMAESADLQEESKFSHIEEVTDLSVPIADDEETPTNLPATQEPEVNVSPRRSSRLITRLPRLQKPVTSLPSSISLKRLGGTEFIAGNHEAQSVAVATRTNTKNNKNGAVPAKVRLIQLNAELKARQFSEEDGAEQQDPEIASKNKNNKGKEVTWAEKLATFQDGQVTKGSSEETDEERNQEGKSDGNSVSEGGGEEGAEKRRSLLRQQNRGVRKVRKLRKLNVGSVNGTPAPKKTTNIPLPVGSTSSLSAKVVGLAAQGESGPEGRRT
ncbi:hypothetical protein CLAIMM_07881 [Cladophialophora immunda]|nr:hypothetical protein CLAIMM_07881 [Cladophialophora immunda]